jgi:chromosome segregation ATPase
MAMASFTFPRQNMDEHAQFQDSRQMTESLQQRLHDLERINLDLESRLEDQVDQRIEVEKECVSLEQAWEGKSELLEQEIVNWKLQYDAQKMKNGRVRENLNRTERELYGVLQRKYDLIRGPGGQQTGMQKASGSLVQSPDSFTGPFGSKEELNRQVISPNCIILICIDIDASV